MTDALAKGPVDYTRSEAVTSPLDFGIPCRRRRLYTLWQKKHRTVTELSSGAAAVAAVPLAVSFGDLPAFQFSRSIMEKLFFRAPVMHCRQFLVASAAAVECYYLRRALARGVPLLHDRSSGEDEPAEHTAALPHVGHRPCKSAAACPMSGSGM